MRAARRRRAPGALRAGILLLGSLFSAGYGLADGQPPTIAIIIDDMGHQKALGQRLVDLDYPLTLAFLPFRRHTSELAKAGYENGKEIMLHAPMANTRGVALGAGGLDVGMSPLDISDSLRRSLQSIPHVRGVNNHMGSLLTQKRELMMPVMAELRRYPLYFVDSRTIASTVAAEVALLHQIPTLSRDVFLDHEQTEEYIHQQFQLLLKLARENGSAIAIGHPHPVTVRYLEEHLPTLDEQGIAVASISALWRLRHHNQPMFVEERKPIVLAAPLVVR
jgi:polysaccharide deacetylase 2 family uncharacterized protein YibQ